MTIMRNVLLATSQPAETGQGELLNVQGVAFTYKPDSVDTDGKYALTEGVIASSRIWTTNTERTKYSTS